MTEAEFRMWEMRSRAAQARRMMQAKTMAQRNEIASDFSRYIEETRRTVVQRSVVMTPQPAE